MVCRSGHKPLRHFYFQTSGSGPISLRIRGQSTFAINVQIYNKLRYPDVMRQTMPLSASPWRVKNNCKKWHWKVLWPRILPKMCS